MLEDRSNLFKIEWIGVGGSRCFHAYDAKNRGNYIQLDPK